MDDMSAHLEDFAFTKPAPSGSDGIGVFTGMTSPPTPETEQSPRTLALVANQGSTSGAQIYDDIASRMLASVGQAANSLQTYGEKKLNQSIMDIQGQSGTPTQTVQKKSTQQWVREFLSNPSSVLVIVVALVILGIGLARMGK